MRTKLTLPFILLAIVTNPLLAQDVSERTGRFAGFVAGASPWQTPYYVTTGADEGPTVMIVGGMHGDEPAGARAADQIRSWPIERGRLVVVPRANVAALTAFTRLMPHKSKEISDLNRNFPRTDGPRGAASVLSGALWALAETERPDWLLDLHEGVGFRASGDESVGSSVICFESADSDPIVDIILDTINEEIEEPGKTFVKLRNPANGSLARAAHERLGAKALILETTRKDQRLSKRVRQHRIMVHSLLRALGMTSDPKLAQRVSVDSDEEGVIRLAVFDEPGTGEVQPYEWNFAAWPDIVTEPMGTEDILNGALESFDAIAFFGGSASRQAKSLGEKGRARVREFIQDGGGYLGICAGAYLATCDYSWSLAILDAKVIDNEKGKWARGKGSVRIDFTRIGRERLAESRAGVDIYYANGPIVVPGERADLEDFRTLAWYRSEFSRNGATPGVMIDSPAMLEGEFGKGRVLCFGCHPDMTRGLHRYLRRAVSWIARD